MKSTPLKSNAALRHTAKKRLRAVPPAGEAQSLPDLRSAMGELRIYEAELEIQNEELRDSRAQIEESHKNYFRHFDLAPVGLIRLNRKGQILEANILGAQMLGEKRVLLNSVPRTFLAHVSSESHVVFQQHLQSTLASGKMETCELSLRNAVGDESFVRIQSVISRSEKDEKDFYLTLTDLTERREIEQKLALQRVLAEAAVTSKELFFGMLSHELRTPLTPLVALLEDLAAEPGRSPEDLAALALMRRNLDLETHLIDDLLDLTRVTGGKLQLHRETTDVHLCLRQAIEICQPDIDAKELQLAIELDAPRHFVDGDASRLQQIFWNLIKNAVKFTPVGGRIAIETRSAEASRLTVEFRDTGVGIDPRPLLHLFEPFFQVQHALKQRAGGLGLGLAICKAITEAHGGTLTAASAGLGKGATFCVELATVAEPSAKLLSGPAADASTPARREDLRLLLVEDHDDTRKVLARLLNRRGYKVEAARNAQEARSLSSERTFDLIISDIALPDASGCDLLKELGTKHKLRGIAMSGFGSDTDLAQSRAAGFLEHLVKPIDARALDTAIQRVVEKSRAGRHTTSTSKIMSRASG
ncbi:MAG: hybrid sensor histidine kinase/response regulator [Verrucomicrobia bacterium]|nr:MAG: hybrid sensor histidine kinase/response regulator [Verrucomicrobiota bacterium]PYL90080.1 MAG: hybrid sensor histidine kinase/response regulator [Verrucomicrobiota bacterium]